MGQSQSISVTAAGVLADPRNSGNAFFALAGDEGAFFVGLTGSYTSLTFSIQGSRDGAWYDIAAYTTDQAGPLIGPLAPTDGVSIAYVGDCRAFKRLRVNILTITGTATVEVQTGNFFFPTAPANNSGQVIYELRALRATLSAWLGLAQGPLPNLPSALIGTGPGGSYPN